MRELYRRGAAFGTYSNVWSLTYSPRTFGTVATAWEDASATPYMRQVLQATNTYFVLMSVRNTPYAAPASWVDAQAPHVSRTQLRLRHVQRDRLPCRRDLPRHRRHGGRPLHPRRRHQWRAHLVRNALTTGLGKYRFGKPTPSLLAALPADVDRDKLTNLSLPG